MPTLNEMREKQIADEAALAKVFTEAKTEDGQLDFTKVECLGDDVKGNSYAVAEKVRALNTELNEGRKKIEVVEEAEKTAKALADRQKAVMKVPHPDASNGTKPQERPKSIGESITSHETFKKWLAGDKSAIIEIPDYGLAELKTTFRTGAGWSPESTRTGLLVEGRTRPIQVLDIIPSSGTAMASVVYMEETTRTHAAVEMNEEGAYAESTFALTERSSTVRKIGTSIPVTDEQLEDVPMVQGYLDQRLRFGVRQRLDGQILTGDGAAPNLRGILNTVDVQVQPKGGDPTPDAIFKAMTLVRVTGRAQPNAIVMHPNDWQDIRLLRTADGIYIWGSPSEAGEARIWGLPVVVTDAETENTALVGDFDNFCQLFERRGIELKIGFNNDDFTTGKQTMRADMRVAFVVFRPTAFCTVTGI